MIELRDIKKTYTMGENTVHALRGISLTIEDGDFVAIMGPSGSGKSTLTQILGLLDVPSSGSYKLNGREISQLEEDELAVFRRHEIGFIFQQFNLLPRLTARENVALPLLYSAHDMDQSIAQPLLDRVGLGTRSGHKPNELSGGQQQRVAIARSLVNKPRMILADEPTGNLDSQSEKEIMDVLRELNEQGITVVIVTHEDEIGLQAKRLIRLRDGNIQTDERREPLRAPKSLPAPVVAVSTEGEDTILGFLRDFFEHVTLGLKTLAANKVRTVLSMLGILIGVAAVVAMLALGKGAQRSIEDQLASLGSNLLILKSGSVSIGGVKQEVGSITRLGHDDAIALKTAIPEIKESAPIVNGRVQVTYGNHNWSTNVSGVGPAYAEMHSVEPEVGRFLTEEDNAKRSRVAVLGATVARELFGDANAIGENFKINKILFQVVGVLPEKGASGFRDQDDVVMIPVKTAMYRLLGKNFVDSIELEAASSDDTEYVTQNALQIMNQRKRIPLSARDEAFQIRNMADIQAALSESNRTMSLLLASIALISLVVGGIGIMNIMLVSVTERTKEIGLRKAIGARRRDILLQFLAESVVVSACGGIIGIILGWTVTLLLSNVAGWAAIVSFDSVALAFLFSASIGVVFGIYPARKAAKLNPIEALRFE